MKLPPKDRLLRLPLEIRTKINRNLLWKARPIGRSKHLYHDITAELGWDPRYDFHVAILRVCRQLYTKGHAILYGENTFGLMTAHGIDFAGLQYSQANMRECNSDLSDYSHHMAASIRYGFPLRSVTRFDISVHNDGFSTGPQDHVGKVSHELSQIPKIRHLKIRLEHDYTGHGHVSEYTPLHMALQPLMLLRNVQNLTFDNIPAHYVHRMRTLMQSSKNLDLLKKYQALQDHVQPFSDCGSECGGKSEKWIQAQSYVDDMENLRENMETGDIKEFEPLGKGVIARVEARIASTKQGLLECGWASEEVDLARGHE